MFRADIAAEFRPLLITSGHKVTFEEGVWHTPKKELVSCLTMLLGTGRLKVDAELPLAKVLVAELRAFKVKVTTAGNEVSSSWRERDHDDLVLAVAMAAWIAERTAVGRFEIH